jgi:GNAT superfamily N-acetyltransferase
MPGTHSPSRPDLALSPAGEGDFESLLSLRLAAMRESLERVGRFDPQRARERLSRGFQPAHTRHILRGGELVGFVVVVPRERDWLLDHLYIHPSAQGEGVGSWVLEQVLREADALHKAVSVTALKHSDANRFYQRHGFELQAEGEWDWYYLRLART